MTRWRLAQVTAPAVEPVSVATAKEHSRIEISADDSLLDIYISAARQWVEDFTGRALITQTWDLYLDCWPTFPLDLPFGNLQSVTHIKYYAEDDTEATWSSSNYQVSAGDPGRIALRSDGETPSTTLRELDAVVIRFVCGYGSNHASVPAAVRSGILLLTGDKYENRENGAVVSAQTLQRAEAVLYPHRLFWKGVA